MRKNLLRLAVFLCCAWLALGFFLPETAKAWTLSLPRFSPLLSFFGALGARRVAGVLCLLGLPLAVLALFKGRWFCWHLCPMGFAAEMAGRLNKRHAGWIRHVPSLNKPLALAVLLTAAIGYPWLIWLDPFCIFNGFFAAWRSPLAWGSVGTGIGFVVLLVLSAFVPNIWCHRLCPLGGLQELLGLPAKKRAAARREEKKVATDDAAVPHVGRRVFLGAVGSGCAGALGRYGLGNNTNDVIRPPNAVKFAFNALCARCGNCMKACPYGLIVPDLGSSGIDGLFTPVLLFRHKNEKQEQYCFQDCNACSEVCPTGALKPITVEEKHAQAIGHAVVDKTKCVAWAQGQYCVVCQEYCPYQAVREVERKGVMCPEIDHSKCRGCGACESACPADPIAIVVHALRRGGQRGKKDHPARV